MTPRKTTRFQVDFAFYFEISEGVSSSAINLLKASVLDNAGIRKKLGVCSTAENYIAHVYKVLKFRWQLSSENFLQGAAYRSGNYQMA